MLNFLKKGKKSSLKKLIRVLISQEKKIIVILGSKGGISKTTIGYGLSKDHNIPFITNDDGSLFAREKKFYDKTYLMYDFENDEYFDSSNCVVIDFKGGMPHTFSKEEKYLIKLATKVILPTGADPVLEHTGCIKTAQEVSQLNTKIVFVSSNLNKKKYKDNVSSFLSLASNFWKPDSLNILALRNGKGVVSNAMLNRNSYIEEFNKCSDGDKDDIKNFIDDWQRISSHFGKLVA